jgi:hypothetical protein
VDPYWVGGITNVPNSSTSQNRVLFFGFQAAPVLRGGDNIGGVNVAHVTGGMDFDVRFSRRGTHWVLDAQVTGSTANDRVMVLDGSALVAGGGFVREGLPIPAAVGGIAGENWANFDFMGVTELGRVFFTGDSSAATTVDESVFDNGQIVLREGTVFAGPGGNYTISGDIEGGYQNRQGDWAVTWDANGPNGVNREILLVNGTMVLQEGDAVDLSGDGVPEPTSKLADFTGISTLVIGPARRFRERHPLLHRRRGHPGDAHQQRRYGGPAAADGAQRGRQPASCGGLPERYGPRRLRLRGGRERERRNRGSR